MSAGHDVELHGVTRRFGEIAAVDALDLVAAVALAYLALRRAGMSAARIAS